MRLVHAKDVSEERVADSFRGAQRRSEFLAELRTRIGAPRTTPTHVVLASDEPVALLSQSVEDDGSYCVPLMRVAGADARTLASYLAHHVRGEAAARGASVVVIDDAGVDSTVRAALEADEYVLDQAKWLKVVCPVLGQRTDIRDWVACARVRTTRPVVEALLDGLAKGGALERPVAVLERQLWPVKVLDSTVPTFVVPVRPSWAQHLFDAELAAQDLFGAMPHLAMSRENVYYRAPRNPRSMPCPARILWYVSGDDRIPGTKAIRACSRLVEVTVGTPKIVYRAGRRLGVYEWKDVAKIAGGDHAGHVQSLRFCDTESFRVPVPLSKVQTVLDELGVGGVNRSFPSPQRIPESAFAEIYRAGMCLGGAHGH